MAGGPRAVKRNGRIATIAAMLKPDGDRYSAHGDVARGAKVVAMRRDYFARLGRSSPLSRAQSIAMS